MTTEYSTPEFLASQGFSVTLPERFWKKVNKTQSCWLWTASTNIHGYPRIGRGSATSGNITAQRASWILHHGPIPIGLSVLHDCPDGDNPLCVNPSHLWLGTHRDNMLDMKEKGRNKNPPALAGEKNPAAKITEENVREIRTLRKNGLTYRAIAALFSTSTSVPYDVCRGNTWAYVK